MAHTEHNTGSNPAEGMAPPAKIPSETIRAAERDKAWDLCTALRPRLPKDGIPVLDLAQCVHPAGHERDGVQHCDDQGVEWPPVEPTKPRETLAEPDPINHPAHYTSHPSGVECITVTEHMGFNLGNALKYLWRADLKGDAIEDLRKAAWYVQREIERRARAERSTFTETPRGATQWGYTPTYLAPPEGER